MGPVGPGVTVRQMSRRLCPTASQGRARCPSRRGALPPLVATARSELSISAPGRVWRGVCSGLGAYVLPRSLDEEGSVGAADRKGGNHDHENASRNGHERQEEQAADARQENPEGSRRAGQGPRRWLDPPPHFLVMPSTNGKAAVGGHEPRTCGQQRMGEATRPDRVASEPSGQHHHIDLSADGPSGSRGGAVRRCHDAGATGEGSGCRDDRAAAQACLASSSAQRA